MRARGDRRHDRARDEQARGALLVFAVDVDDDVALGGRSRERRQDPGGERIGVHGDRDRRERGAAVVGLVALEPQGGGRVVLQQAELAGEAHQRLPRFGGAHRLRAHHEHAPEFLLQHLDALADGGRRHVETLGRGVEGARFDHGGEGLEQIAGESHH